MLFGVHAQVYFRSRLVHFRSGLLHKFANPTIHKQLACIWVVCTQQGTSFCGPARPLSISLSYPYPVLILSLSYPYPILILILSYPYLIPILSLPNPHPIQLRIGSDIFQEC